MTLESVNNEDGRHYVRTWVIVLKIFLGWSEVRTLKWADKWLDGLNEANSLFYNGTPIFYITPLLIPDRLRRRLPRSELAHLNENLLLSIQLNNSFCDRDQGFDWESARTRVQTLLTGYGESLPLSEADCKLWQIQP